MPLLNLLSVKYVIQPTVHGAQPWELHLWEYPDQFELLYDDGNYQIFHNKYALPRFYVTTFQQFGSNSQEVIDSVLRNPLSLTFTTNFPSANYNVAPIILLQAAKINSYTPTKIELAVESTTAGWLYASETWYPGWQAQIDGRDTSIQRANLTFRAIPISPGTHIVTMTYQPLSFIVGILTTAATALLILIFHRKIYVS
ncbi:MAG: YfhO family protein [Candidatus Chisholmbacteria bacterium]|nr:YfhO family protein [Candidatus Chisholmbacteria bacterium]